MMLLLILKLLQAENGNSIETVLCIFYKGPAADPYPSLQSTQRLREILPTTSRLSS